MKKTTRASQDALETMVIIESEGEKITVSRLASMMEISKPSVVELLQRLSSRATSYTSGIDR